MGSDATAITPATIDSLPLAAWWESRGVSRSTAFRLVKIAGITPGRMKVPTSRVPVACLDAEQIQALDTLAARVRDGVTLPQLEAELTTALAAPGAAAETVSNDSDTPSPATDAAALLARLEAGERALRTGLPLSSAEVAWLLQARPGGDRVIRAGVEAIRHGRNCWQLRQADSV